MTLGLCAYAITLDHEPDLLPGTDVRLVPHRGLGLVVADVELTQFAGLDTDPAIDVPREDDPLVVLARRHDAVVRAVFECRPVLPLRFGTVLRDEEAATRLLSERHALAKCELDRVAGHREWGVRARLPRRSDDGAVRPDGLSGTEYLAQRRKRLTAAEHGRRRGAADATALHAALARHATDTASRAHRSPGLLLDAAYLVPAGEEAAFHAELRRGEGGVEVAVTGPWPPYSFARLEAGDRSEAIAHG